MNYSNGPHTTSPSVEKDVPDGHDELNNEEHLSKHEHIVAFQ